MDLDFLRQALTALGLTVALSAAAGLAFAFLYYEVF